MAMSVPVLKTFYVYLTSGCNCACRHCWFVPERQNGAEEEVVLDPEVLRHAIEQALPLGLAAIKWTGGEPTLHPCFRQLLGLQKEYGLDAIVETNGMLVDDELAALMRGSGVSRVSVSLDGADSETHDAIRCVKGGFKKTLMGIRSLADAGFQPELILTMQQSNKRHLSEFFALAMELGAGAVKLNVLQPVLRAETLSSQGNGLSINEVLEISQKVSAEWSEQVKIPVQMGVPHAFRPLSRILSGDDDGVCNIMHVLGILPSGSYALCGVGQHVAELSLGAVMSAKLKEVWKHHQVLKRLRDGLPGNLQGICRDCLMQEDCLGSCVAANYQLSGDLLAAYWFCQQAADQGLFPATRRRTNR